MPGGSAPGMPSVPGMPGGGGGSGSSSAGGSMFESSMGNLKSMQSGILGEDYDYSAKIKSTSDLGMGPEGDLDTLENDIAGIMGYVKVLIESGGDAQTIDGPLGGKFFLPTAAKCKDVETKAEVTRSLYINNQADGSIPFISQGMGVTFGQFKGLVPGILGNVAQINPFQLLSAFMTDKMPACQAIVMPTIPNSGQLSYGTGYVLLNDIKYMNPCWFPNRTNPVTGITCREAFETMGDDTEEKQSATMPQDWLVRLYYTSLALLGLYIFLKLLKKKVAD